MLGMLCLRTFEGKCCPHLALVEWLSRSGIIYSLLLACVGKYTNFSMCSALGSGGTSRAQQLWAGWVKELGGEGWGREGGCCWGEVGAVSPMDGLSLGSRRGSASVPAPLLAQQEWMCCFSSYGPLGACDGPAVCVAVPRGARRWSRSNSE